MEAMVVMAETEEETTVEMEGVMMVVEETSKHILSGLTGVKLGVR